MCTTLCSPLGAEWFARYGGRVRTISPARAPLLALTDAAAIVVFASIGLASHRHGLTAAGYARDALPLLGGWFAAAALFGLYRGGGIRALLATWAVGVPLGVLVRALALGRALDGKQAAFLGVALTFILLLVLALRTALSLGSRDAL
jgi:hypothetical protein